MLHRNVSITGSRIKRVTFYIPAVTCKKGAKGNLHNHIHVHDMFVILNK